MIKETFVVRLQAQNRIVIPEAIAELLGLKKGEKLRVSVEKVIRTV